MKYNKSSLAGIQNLDEIYELLIENCGNPETRFHPTAGDLSYLVNFEEELENFKNKAFQWRDNNKNLVGIVFPDYRGTYYICTRQTNREIYEIILDDLEAEIMENNEIWLWSCETDTVRQTVLKKKKYSTNGWYMFFGHKSLVDFTPTISLSEGYKIRELTDSDLPVKLELMGVSSGDIKFSRTIAKYRNMQKSIVYDNRTDLVVVNKNNIVVAFINGWFDIKNAIGSIEPCRTSDQHSGKGLMTNLMNHLFMIYKQNGINDVYIPHGGLCTYEDENDDAMLLYKKLGFKEVYKMFIRIKNYDPSKHDEYENRAYIDFLKKFIEI
jgi:ribosomal protein S18 acetylase RimI-like enzyme